MRNEDTNNIMLRMQVRSSGEKRWAGGPEEESGGGG